MKNKFTACFERDGKFWIGYVKEIPGANTQGKTMAEARRNLREAVELILQANREIAEKRSRGQQVICEPILVSA